MRTDGRPATDLGFAHGRGGVNRRLFAEQLRLARFFWRFGKGIDEGHGGMMCPLVSETKLGQAGEGGELGEMAVAAQLGGREVKVEALEGELAVD